MGLKQFLTLDKYKGLVLGILIFLFPILFFLDLIGGIESAPILIYYITIITFGTLYLFFIYPVLAAIISPIAAYIFVCLVGTILKNILKKKK